MDIALTIMLAQAVAAQPVVDVVGQAYIVLNTASLIGAAFWLGVQWNTIRTNRQSITELQRKIDGHVIPIAEMKTKIDSIQEDVEQLTSSIDRLQRSIFMEAMRVSRREDNDAETRSGD